MKAFGVVGILLVLLAASAYAQSTEVGLGLGVTVAGEDLGLSQLCVAYDGDGAIGVIMEAQSNTDDAYPGALWSHIESTLTGNIDLPGMSGSDAVPVYFFVGKTEGTVNLHYEDMTTGVALDKQGDRCTAEQLALAEPTDTVPEFGTVAAALALVGAFLGVIAFRKH